MYVDVRYRCLIVLRLLSFKTDMLPHFNFVIYQHIHDISYHICNSNCNENDNFVSVKLKVKKYILL